MTIVPYKYTKERIQFVPYLLTLNSFMAKVKIERGFGMIPNELLYNAEISLASKGLYGFIYAKPDDWNFSVERIAEELKESVNTIRSYMKELEKFGWLTREKFKNSKGQWDVEYQLFSTPKQGEVENHHQKTTDGELVTAEGENNKNHHQKTVDGKLANNKINNKKYINNSHKGELLETSQNFSLKNSSNFSENSAEMKISEENKHSPSPPKAPRSPVGENHSLEYLNEQAQKINLGENIDVPDFVPMGEREEFMRFLLYWTESDNHGKIRAKKEKTFEIKRRFLIWLSRRNNFSVQKNPHYGGNSIG